MALLREGSCHCTKSELDIFSVKPTQTSILGYQDVEYKPTSSLVENAPIEFHIPASGEEYIDLPHTMLYVQAKIVKSDDSLLTSTDKTIGPVNYFLHTLFSEVQIYLNNKLVSFPSHMYPYRAYIESLLNYDEPAKSSHLQQSLWFKDTAGYMDAVDANNKGFTKRFEFSKLSKTFDMLGYLHCDIFNQEKFLINGVELRIKLIPSKNSFCLMGETGSDGKVKLLDVALIVRKVSISASVKLSHSKILRQYTAKYPISRVQLKAVTIAKGIMSKTIDNLILGPLPKRVIIGFLNNDAFNGTFTTNPFHFKHFKYNFFSLYIDGTPVPSKPLQPNFDSGHFIRAYHTLFAGSGIDYLDEGNNIQRSDYAQGFSLLAFDLTPDQSANATSHWCLTKHGTLRMEVHFSEALLSTISCLVYSEFDTELEVDGNRDVRINL